MLIYVICTAVFLLKHSTVREGWDKGGGGGVSFKDLNSKERRCLENYKYCTLYFAARGRLIVLN